MKDNEKINADKTYWQIHFYSKPATEVPRTRISPTEPPMIPEPHLRDVYCLLDPNALYIVASAFNCVVT